MNNLSRTTAEWPHHLDCDKHGKTDGEYSRCSEVPPELTADVPCYDDGQTGRYCLRENETEKETDATFVGNDALDDSVAGYYASHKCRVKHLR